MRKLAAGRMLTVMTGFQIPISGASIDSIITQQRRCIPCCTLCRPSLASDVNTDSKHTAFDPPNTARLRKHPAQTGGFTTHVNVGPVSQTRKETTVAQLAKQSNGHDPCDRVSDIEVQPDMQPQKMR